MIRVAVVDDDPFVRAGLRAILSTAADLEVVGDADDGAGVPELVRTTAPDVVVMDIRMPLLDGYAAASAIRSLNRADAVSVPIIAMSADAFTDDVNRCLDAGMNGHIAKPIDPEKLYAGLQEAVQHRSLMEMEPDGNTAETAER